MSKISIFGNCEFDNDKIENKLSDLIIELSQSQTAITIDVAWCGAFNKHIVKTVNRLRIIKPTFWFNLYVPYISQDIYEKASEYLKIYLALKHPDLPVDMPEPWASLIANRDMVQQCEYFIFFHLLAVSLTIF